MVKLEQISEQHVIKEPDNKALMQRLGMIITYPKDLSFATQNEGEYAIIIVRKHLIRNLPWMLNALFLFIAPTIVGVLLGIMDSMLFQNELAQSDLVQAFNEQLLGVFLLFYYTICVTYSFLKFIHWYYDVFMVTNERFVSIDFDVFKGQTVTDIPLQDIIDISERATGFWAVMFGYGNIEFKTTSEKFIVIASIAQPTWFRDSFADLIKFLRENDKDPYDPFDVVADSKKEEPIKAESETRGPVLERRPMNSLEP